MLELGEDRLNVGVRQFVVLVTSNVVVLDSYQGLRRASTMPRVLRSSTKKKRETPARKRLKDLSPPKLEIAASAGRTPRRRPLASGVVKDEKVADMSINTIRKELKKYAADTTGTKVVLQARLIDILKSGAKPKPATPSTHNATPKRSKTPRGTPRSARKRRNLEEITNVDVSVLSRIEELGKGKFAWDGKEVSKLTVIDLKEILHVLGLIKTGLKQELQERVVDAFKLCKSSSADTNVVKDLKPASNTTKQTSQAKENTFTSEVPKRRADPSKDEPVNEKKQALASTDVSSKSEAAESSLSEFTVDQLRHLLRNRDKKTAGRKSELIRRLRRLLLSSKEPLSALQEEVKGLEIPDQTAASKVVLIPVSASNRTTAVAGKSTVPSESHKKQVPSKSRKKAVPSESDQRVLRTSPALTESHSSTLLAGRPKSPFPSKSPRMPPRRKTPSHLLQSLKQNSPQPVGTLLSSKVPSPEAVPEASKRTLPAQNGLEETETELPSQDTNSATLPVTEDVPELPEHVPPKAIEAEVSQHAPAKAVEAEVPQHVPREVIETKLPEGVSPGAVETKEKTEVNEASPRETEQLEDGEDDEGYFTPEEAPENTETELKQQQEKQSANDVAERHEQNQEMMSVEAVVSEPVAVEAVDSMEESSSGGASSNEILENLVLQIASKGITSRDFEEYDNILKGLVVEEDDEPVPAKAPSTNEVRLERPTPVRINNEEKHAQQAPASDFALSEKRTGQTTTPAGPPKWRQSLLSTLGGSTGDVSPFYDMGPSYSSRKSNPGTPQYHPDVGRNFSEKNTYNRNSLVRPRPAVTFLNAQDRLPQSLKKPRLDTPYLRKPITPQPRLGDSILHSRAF